MQLLYTMIFLSLCVSAYVMFRNWLMRASDGEVEDLE